MGPKNNEVYTFTQLKEMMKNDKERMMTFFNATVDRLEKKITDLSEENAMIKNELKEMKKSVQFP